MKTQTFLSAWPRAISATPKEGGLGVSWRARLKRWKIHVRTVGSHRKLPSRGETLVKASLGVHEGSRGELRASHLPLE
jgi:hypothetical protein